MSFVEKFVRIVSPSVLFYLMFCFAATIHPKQFQEKLKSRGIIIGVVLQLIVMPLVGFIILQGVEVSGPSQVIFMALLSSPGGAFSNFLISIFNGDLALSVAMTTVSTLFSIAFLPWNLFFYLDVLGEDNGTGGAAASIDYSVLGRIIIILVSGVFLGLYANHKIPHKDKLFYKIGNICAILQTLLGLLISNQDTPFYEKPPELFTITFIAVVVALAFAMGAAFAARMEKPETFSVIVEVAVQNASVSVAFGAAAFQGAELSEALSIPVLHSIFTTFLTLFFAFWAYYAGWTYSPKGVPLCTALGGYYQPRYIDQGPPRKSSARPEIERPEKQPETNAPDTEQEVEPKSAAPNQDTFNYVV